MPDETTDRIVKLARWSYGLACAGPLSLIMTALYYANKLSDQAVPATTLITSNAIVICSPIGATFGFIAVIMSRKQKMAPWPVRHAYAGILIGLFATYINSEGGRVLRNSASSVMTNKSFPCAWNALDIGENLIKFAQSHNGMLPAPQIWNSTIHLNFKDSMVCPDTGSESLPTYAVNKLLFNHKLSTVQNPENTVLVFESTPGKNLSGGPELLPDMDRHFGRVTVCFVDGKTTRVPREDVGDLIWNPTFTKSNP